MMSKLYAGFLVIASLFAMAALGVLILILITDLSNLVIPLHNPGSRAVEWLVWVKCRHAERIAGRLCWEPISRR